MTYFEMLNELTQEIGRFFDRGYYLRIESDKSLLNLYSKDEDVISLIKQQKPIFYIKLRIADNHRSGERHQPIDCSAINAIADSIECASRNAIELIMRYVVKGSVDSRSGDYEHFCNLNIFKDKCFFTPYGLYWGDWEMDNGFACSALRMCRSNKPSPIDRDEWVKFKQGVEEKC